MPAEGAKWGPGLMRPQFVYCAEIFWMSAELYAVQDNRAKTAEPLGTHLDSPAAGKPVNSAGRSLALTSNGRRRSTRRTGMQKFPHRYVVVAGGDSNDDIELASGTLAPLRAAAPTEFDGPGDRWSPETLLVGAVAGCYLLTFRAVARASRVSWTWLRCEVTGTLERLDSGTQFTAFDLRARLSIPATMDAGQARRALEKAERQCLVSTSLKAPVHLTLVIEVDDLVIEPEAVAGVHSHSAGSN